MATPYARGSSRRRGLCSAGPPVGSGGEKPGRAGQRRPTWGSGSSRFLLLCGGERWWSADRAEVDAGQQPAVTAAYGHVRGAEPAVDRAALVCGLLGVDADGHRRVAVVANLDLGQADRRGHEVAGAVAVQPLRLGEHESDRADQGEVVGSQRGQLVDIATLP